MCRARKRLTLQEKFGLEFCFDAFLLQAIPEWQILSDIKCQSSYVIGIYTFFPSKVPQNKIAAYLLHKNVH